MANNIEQPDTREPSAVRKAELETAYEKQKDTDAPYKGVWIRTLGELQWIMRKRHWFGSMDITNLPDGLPDGMERANLSGTDFEGTNLSGANLAGADLSEATLIRTNLSGAHLFFNTNLSNANLDHANLSKADCGLANFTDSRLNNTNLDDINLSQANLSGANLERASLKGTRLDRALMNAETILDGITLTPTTRVFGVRWNGVPLDAIDWKQAPRFGDEPTTEALAKMKPQDRATAFRNAARAYHGLSVALRDQGLADVASTYRLRELVMERKAMRYERNYGGWFLNMLLGAVAGHGEKPGRAFVAYLGIVTSFAIIYWLVTNFLHSGAQPLQWYEAVVLSVSPFHGRGFFTNTIQLGDPLAIVAAIEAMMGLFIELVFIATFSRRFLGD
jgi:hypothetical protein